MTTDKRFQENFGNCKVNGWLVLCLWDWRKQSFKPIGRDHWFQRSVGMNFLNILNSSSFGCSSLTAPYCRSSFASWYSLEDWDKAPLLHRVPVLGWKFYFRPRKLRILSLYYPCSSPLIQQGFHASMDKPRGARIHS